MKKQMCPATGAATVDGWSKYENGGNPFEWAPDRDSYGQTQLRVDPWPSYRSTSREQMQCI